jgi:hypothetical protein
MHAEANGSGLVMPMPNRMASRLPKAKTTRHELTDEKSKTTKPLAWHDLRGTYCTWSAVRGDSPLQIMQRSGNTHAKAIAHSLRFADVDLCRLETLVPSAPDVNGLRDTQPIET